MRRSLPAFKAAKVAMGSFTQSNPSFRPQGIAIASEVKSPVSREKAKLLPPWAKGSAEVITKITNVQIN
jgi:hypothetical protein